ncbi:MAG: hypothetical protein J6Q81_01935, partial [Lentisphaeria bacterium]|nr:hypothetical protein [Lentisphaeria bacterium]
PDFTIDENGRLERSGSWLLSSADTGDDISLLAASWAGSVNDFWRIPSADGRSYTLDQQLKVKYIECTALDSRHCRVKFTASTAGNNDTPGGIEAVTGSFLFERKKDFTEYKTISYKLAANDLALLPQIGSLLDWAGSVYRCEEVNCKENSDEIFTAEVRAVNIAVQSSGVIDSEEQHDQKFKTGTWLIMPEALDDFLQTNALHESAPWAGDNFYVYKLNTSPADSAGRTRVTITARYSKLEMIESLRSEEVVAVTQDVPQKRLVWQSRWRAAAGDREFFENKLGGVAQDWTSDSRAIVSKVTPKRISDCEFEYLLEARYPEDIASDLKFDAKDLELPDRLEYYTRIGEMRLSPGQCGYTWRHNGTYRLINNWQFNQLCPLVTTVALNLRWINQPLKLLEIVEVSYLSGTSSKNISQIVSWFTGQRVINTSLAGISGCFLRYDLEVDDITDSRDRDWTRISRIYRKSPNNYDWNTNYWI